MTLTRSQTQDHEIRDRRLPGRTFLAAISDRQLMSWSDRGGASNLIGEQWASRCSTLLQSALGTKHSFGTIGTVRVASILRLDDQPAVEREANRHQLENPDFLVLGSNADGEPIAFAADAKFAADRIKLSQVSAETTRLLIDVPERGTVRTLLDEAVNDAGMDEPVIVDGTFVVPDASMTDLLLVRRQNRLREDLDEDRLVRFPPDPGSLFDGLPMSSLVTSLARIDGLPVSPRTSLLSSVYYFRVACACHYLWHEEHYPLLTASKQELEPDAGVIAAQVTLRATANESAYGLLLEWNRDLRRITAKRKAVRDAMRLPVGMKEIHERLDRAEINDPKTAAKFVRGDLEIAFRRRLIEQVGEISAADHRSANAISKQVSRAAQSLRPAMLALLDDLVAEHVAGSQPS